ncbi:MAG: hypothetical protein ACI90U_002988 [Pseudomonadales bacterium]|jgi:hypothetical protein
MLLANPYLMAFATTAAIGILCELTARIGKFWLYRKPIFPILNIILMFGIVMGALSLLCQRSGLLPVFIIATAIGYAYEKINFSTLHWWDLPNDRFLVFKGKEACARSIAVLWGITPLISNAIQSAIL